MKLTGKQAVELAASANSNNQNHAIYAVSFDNVKQAGVELDELKKDKSLSAGVAAIDYKPHVMLHKRVIDEAANKAVRTLLQKAKKYDTDTNLVRVSIADIREAGLDPKKLLDDNIARGHTTTGAVNAAGQTTDDSNAHLIFTPKELANIARKSDGQEISR